jgi:hypothetical protein
MFAKIDIFEERTNRFFNAMVGDLNPHIYKISTDRFVFNDKALKMTGQVPLPNATIIIYINGIVKATTSAFGDGTFTVYFRPVNNENNIEIEYI